MPVTLLENILLEPQAGLLRGAPVLGRSKPGNNNLCPIFWTRFAVLGCCARGRAHSAL